MSYNQSIYYGENSQNFREGLWQNGQSSSGPVQNTTAPFDNYQPVVDYNVYLNLDVNQYNVGNGHMNHSKVHPDSQFLQPPATYPAHYQTQLQNTAERIERLGNANAQFMQQVADFGNGSGYADFARESASSGTQAYQMDGTETEDIVSECTNAVTMPTDSQYSAMSETWTSFQKNHPPVINMETQTSSSSRKRRVTCDELFSQFGRIETKPLVKKVVAKLDELKIIHSVFAEKVLSRGQGTFSEILKCPKDWDKMNAGRIVYMRMQAWLNAPDKDKKAIEHLSVKESEVLLGLPPATKTKKCRKVKANKNNQNSEGAEPTPKRTRLVFTEKQREELNNIFNKVSRPNRKTMDDTAKRLGLKYSTVENFFMNKRRRTLQNTQVNFNETVRIQEDIYHFN